MTPPASKSLSWMSAARWMVLGLALFSLASCVSNTGKEDPIDHKIFYEDWMHPSGDH
jgi:hypothetical protein